MPPKTAVQKERKKVHREVTKMQQTATRLMNTILKEQKYSGFRRVGQ